MQATISSDFFKRTVSLVPDPPVGLVAVFHIPNKCAAIGGHGFYFASFARIAFSSSIRSALGSG